MKSFRTDFALQAEPFFDQSRPILTLGSCFAEHVGQRLINAKWQGLNAPFGTLFHPLALTKLLRLSLLNQDLDSELLVEHDGAFFHHDLHSRFYAKSPEALQDQWRSLAQSVRAVLAQEPYVLLTLGTAWIYEKISNGKIVANCHKQPAQQFHKRLLTTEEIQSHLDELLQLLPATSPVIISLSPVRHIRDTMVGNSLSKSLLLVNIHSFVSRYSQRAHYFPAYEILLDDLRDYRFYETDMIHPSLEAVDYIWNKFTSCYCPASTQKFLQRWQSIQLILEHRPQRLDAPSYQKHLQNIIKELRAFSLIDCRQELAELESRLLEI